MRLVCTFLVCLVGINTAAIEKSVSAQVSAGSLSREDSSFLATLHCQIACVDGPTESAVVNRGFDAPSFGLLPGDGSGGVGSPWGAFTGTLESWSRMECLEAAAQHCDGLEKVGQCDIERLTSGSWVLDRREPCPDARQAEHIDFSGQDPRAVFLDYVPVLSPFSPGSGAIRSGDSIDKKDRKLPTPELGAVLTGPDENPTQRRVDQFEYWMDRAITFLEVPENLTSDDRIRSYLLDSMGVESEEEYVDHKLQENTIGPAPPCSTIIRGRACYGDCLEYPEGREREQYLATNKVSGENVGSIAVCGDQLVSFFSENPMSIAAKEIYCERFLMESLVAGRTTAFTCSSYRIRVDCSALF